MGTSQAKKMHPRIQNQTMVLRGVPTRDDFALEGDVMLTKDGDGVELVFKVVSADQDGMEAFETLSAFAVNRPEAVRFELWADDDDLWLRLANSFEDSDGWVLGKVPAGARMVVTEPNNWCLIERYGQVVGFGLILSLVGHEVDRNRVMGLADDDELDEMSDNEFDRLIVGARDMMNREAAVTILRIRLSPGCTGWVPVSAGEGDIIDV